MFNRKPYAFVVIAKIEDENVIWGVFDDYKLAKATADQWNLTGKYDVTIRQFIVNYRDMIKPPVIKYWRPSDGPIDVAGDTGYTDGVDATGRSAETGSLG